MRDTALRILGLQAASARAVEAGNDEWVELDIELEAEAIELAHEVIEHDPFEHHTRMGEVFQYAQKRGICVHVAIAELVNTALALQVEA